MRIALAAAFALSAAASAQAAVQNGSSYDFSAGPATISPTAVIGGAIWCTGYAGLGFVFAGQISEISALISSSVGTIMAGALTLTGITILTRSYRNRQQAII